MSSAVTQPKIIEQKRSDGREGKESMHLTEPDAAGDGPKEPPSSPSDEFLGDPAIGALKYVHYETDTLDLLRSEIKNSVATLKPKAPLLYASYGGVKRVQIRNLPKDISTSEIKRILALFGNLVPRSLFLLPGSGVCHATMFQGKSCVLLFAVLHGKIQLPGSPKKLEITFLRSQEEYLMGLPPSIQGVPLNCNLFTNDPRKALISSLRSDQSRSHREGTGQATAWFTIEPPRFDVAMMLPRHLFEPLEDKADYAGPLKPRIDLRLSKVCNELFVLFSKGSRVRHFELEELSETTEEGLQRLKWLRSQVEPEGTQRLYEIWKVLKSRQESEKSTAGQRKTPSPTSTPSTLLASHRDESLGMKETSSATTTTGSATRTSDLPYQALSSSSVQSLSMFQLLPTKPSTSEPYLRTLDPNAKEFIPHQDCTSPSFLTFPQSAFVDQFEDFPETDEAWENFYMTYETCNGYCSGS
ncbi:unnamed protein product [Cyprideis torosa]|uniref:Uncharacterized protein n=1 Tax=Cyprideis torosa TaxID=163714 RepID=A0A7R8WD32_9CRUS|nr:unnamed protein product [Cyprideis torosa]CAG0888962.1 unnamed protein product [Cyprideis torosa]